jgi:uncharacterized protein YuzE
MVQQDIVGIKKNMELKVNYDPKGDVLYMFFGEPRAAVSEEIADGEFLRFDPETRQPVGITVIDFYKRFSEHPGNILSFSFPQFWPADGKQEEAP